MATVLEITEIQLEWQDLQHLTYHPRNESIRSDGVHVSNTLSLLRDYSITAGMYTEEDKDDEMPLRILLGLAFEESAARLYKDMHWQPGELEHGGLKGSPDGLSLVFHPSQHSWEDTAPKGYWVGPRPCVDEFKYTGKSQRIKGRKSIPGNKLQQEDLKDIRTEWLWMQQVMAYINLLRRTLPGCEKMDLGRFHICWKYGAYQYPMREIYMRYLVQFTDAELNGNWAMMRAFQPVI